MRISVFVFVVLAAAASRAQQIELIQNPSARQGVSLNGRWQALMDPYEAGYYDFHLNPMKDGGLGANRAPADKGDKFELAFLPATPTLAVPGDWNTQQPELLWYEGSIWYRHEFDYAPPAAPRRQFLWFGAANYQAVVFLNGRKLGQHEGGFTPFQFEVTGLLKEHGNAVIVKVDNQRHADAVPPAMTDWWNYGGLDARREAGGRARDFHRGLPGATGEGIGGPGGWMGAAEWRAQAAEGGHPHCGSERERDGGDG